MSYKFNLSMVLVGATLLAASVSHATFVPAGTLTINLNYNATVTTGSTDTITYRGTTNSTSFFGDGVPGDFFQALGGLGSTAATTLSFNPTVGSIVSYAGSSAINNLFVFTDGSGETYDFNLDNSITGLGSNGTGTGSTVSLYLLGDLTGAGNVSYAATPTAVTISLTQNGASGYSYSSTLSNPPPGINIPSVPEPASMVLMGSGLAALGWARRRKAR
jgi:hypothetical protein